MAEEPLNPLVNLKGDSRKGFSDNRRHNGCYDQGMDLNVLSQIRIIASERILPFEWTDDIASIRASEIDLSGDSVIRHPFPVTKLEGGAYLLLEQPDEFQLLVNAGLELLPVQVCPPGLLALRTDKVGLVNFAYDDLARLVSRHPAQFITEEETSGKSVATGFVQVMLEFNDGRSVSLRLRHSSQSGCPTPLDCIFRLILRKGRYIPMIEPPNSPHAVIRSVPISATMTLPPFGLKDISKAATAERLFPPRVIRVVPRCRILNIDLPVSVLLSDVSLEDKETFLKELVVLREQSCRTSFYEGRVYLLNR